MTQSSQACVLTMRREHLPKFMSNIFFKLLSNKLKKKSRGADRWDRIDTFRCIMY